MSKAFAAWRLHTKSERSVRLANAAAAVDKRKSVEQAKQVTQLSERMLTLEREHGATQDLLASDLHATSKTFDSMKLVAQRLRAENTALKDQLQQVCQTEVDSRQKQIELVQAEVERWKTMTSRELLLSPADNEFENFNRQRLEYYTVQVLTPKLLIQWAFDIVKPIQGVEMRVVFGDTAAKDAVPSYVLLLHTLSPGHVSFTDAVRAFASSESEVQCAALISAIDHMHLGPLLERWEFRAFDSKPPQQHILFLAILFARFCGVGALEPLLPPTPADDRRWTPVVTNASAVFSRPRTISPTIVMHGLHTLVGPTLFLDGAALGCACCLSSPPTRFSNHSTRKNHRGTKKRTA